jgi:hypothetical protein
MARYPAIAATSEALLGLLESATAGTEFSGMSFEHYQATDFQTPMKAGVSLFLHRVTVNPNRNLSPRRDADGRRYRAAIPVDLHYLLTAWADDAVKQQRLLGFAVRTVEDTPILPAGLLNHFGPEPDVFRPEETVEVVWEAVSVQDLSDIWKVAQTKAQPSATYAARMVAIESSRPLEEGPPVQTRELRFTEALA